MWIDDLLAYRLLENAVEDDPNDPPDFSPESDFGEGTPPTFEEEYRSQILLLLSILYLAIRDTLDDDKLTADQQKTRINVLVDSFTTQGENRISTELQKIYKLGGQAANQEVLSVGLYPRGGLDETRLRVILLQQKDNLRFVANAIRDNAFSQINWRVLQEQYKIPSQYKFTATINQPFREARTRLDRMASYGATATYSEGKLRVFREFEDQIMLNWITRGDSKVCGICRYYQDNSPFKPSEFPAPPHTGCRCYPSIATEGRGDDGMDLFVLPIIDNLTSTS